jgi:hypothetical protein
MIDKVLKGASQGYAQGQQYAADQYNKKLAATQTLYNDQAAQLYDLAKSGRAGTFSGPPGKDGKPTFVPSDEFNQAKGRMLVAWQAMMQTVGQRIPQPKKSKGKAGGQDTGVGSGGASGAAGGDPNELLQQALNHKGDPQGSLVATYRIGLAIGPPVIHQIGGFLTPAYIAQQQQGAQTAATTSTTAGVTAGNQLTDQQALAERNRVLAIPESTRTEADKQKLSSAEDILAPQAKAAPANYKQFISADGKTRRWFDVTKPIEQGWSAAPVGAGSNRAPKEGWTKQGGQWGSQLYDPETNQPIPDTFNSSKVPPGNVLSMFPQEHTLTGKFVDSNGLLTTYSTTNESHRDLPGGIGSGGAGASDSVTPHAAEHNASASPSTSGDTGYQAWVKKNGFREDPTYDLYGAYKAGLQPAANGHLSDEFKLATHPTYSTDSKYSQQPGAPPAGEWVAPAAGENAHGKDDHWTFKATDTNVKNAGGVAGLKSYFDRIEPGNTLILPNGESYTGKSTGRQHSSTTPAPAKPPAVPAPAPAKPPAVSAPPSTGAGTKTHVIGYVGSKSYKDLVNTADKASAVSSSLARECKQALADAKSVLANPADGPAKMGLVASYLRNVVGAHSAAGAGGASVRITNNEWNSAIQTRSSWAGLLSHFDTHAKGGDVILTGITITPKQALGMAREIQQRAVGAQTEHGTMAAAAEDQRKKDMHAGGLVPPATPSTTFNWQDHPVAR